MNTPELRKFKELLTVFEISPIDNLFVDSIQEFIKENTIFCMVIFLILAKTNYRYQYISIFSNIIEKEKR